MGLGIRQFTQKDVEPRASVSSRNDYSECERHCCLRLRFDGGHATEAHMKNVLLLIHDDAGEAARFQAALDLARAISGHLTCLDIVQAPILVGAGYVMVDAELALLAHAREREAANRRQLEVRLAVEDIAWDWADAAGDIAKLLEAEAALADNIVLNTLFANPELPDMRVIASDIVMRAGKPILAVPREIRSRYVNGQALIAWNGAPAVAETLRAVTPLLALAEDAAAYLSRHGIHVIIDRDVPLEGSVCDALLGACRDRHPAYCVIGAYGHSRLREQLIGGVTRRMLAESPVPLLLGH
ncbi:universal stress protein [Novosphingobium sp. BL-52-GroH]|uniref:universal stress protein n=1 Tax=Novosphingobium sp. BL-52-GroH TaxID=3349877 RepID=UPI00384E9462